MKAGWKTVKIGEVCELLTGGTPSRLNPEYFGGNIRWLVSGDVNQKQIFECEGRITALGLENSNARLLPKNSVMIALAGQGKTRGTVAMLRVEATCNQSMVCMAPREPEKLLPEFLYYNLHGRYQEIRRLTGDDGNDRRGLNMGIIYHIEIPLPPLAEQKRIVALLDEAFAGIDEAKVKAEDLELKSKEFRGSVLSQLLDPKEANTKAGWSDSSLGEVCDILDFKRRPVTKADRRAGPYPYYGATGVQDYVDQFIFDEPLVLLGEDGAKWKSGDRSAFLVSGKTWVNNHAHVLRPNRGIIADEWLVYWLNHSDLTDFITGVTVPKLNQGNMVKIPVPLPPLAEQKRIVALLDEAFAGTGELSSHASLKMSKLSELKSSLLSQAFAGELTA